MSQYPTKVELQKIRDWQIGDYTGLMDYVESLWNWSDFMFKRFPKHKYRLATGGWSGNEDIISAMQENRIFWISCWKWSRRGGAFFFEIPKNFVTGMEDLPK